MIKYVHVVNFLKIVATIRIKIIILILKVAQSAASLSQLRILVFQRL